MTDDSSRPFDTGSSADTTPDSSRDGQISLDELHRLLASDRRRRLLSYLSTKMGESTFKDELVAVIAERERPDPGPSTHRERVATDLHHVHLPKLADAGVIDYDPVAETVTYTGSNRLETLLNATSALKGDTD